MSRFRIQSGVGSRWEERRFREVEIKAMQSAWSNAGSLKDVYVPDVCRGLRLGAWFRIHAIPEHWYRSRMEEHDLVRSAVTVSMRQRSFSTFPTRYMMTLILSSENSHYDLGIGARKTGCHR